MWNTFFPLIQDKLITFVYNDKLRYVIPKDIRQSKEGNVYLVCRTQDFGFKNFSVDKISDVKATKGRLTRWWMYYAHPRWYNNLYGEIK